MAVANLGRPTVSHSSHPDVKPDEWIDRFADWLKQWFRLLRDLKYSTQFPRRRLAWSLGLAFGGVGMGFLAVAWDGCCLTVVAPPNWAMTVAYVAVVSAIASLLIIILVLVKLLFPFSGTVGVSSTPFERLQAEVRDFQVLIEDFTGKVATMGEADRRRHLREIREELRSHIERFRTLKRVQFVVVVFVAILTALFLFSTLFLVDFTLEMGRWSSVPVYDFYDFDHGGPWHRILSSFHASVATFLSMGIGTVRSPLVKVIAILEALFAALIVFFGMNMALAFQQQTMDLDQRLIMRQFQRIFERQSSKGGFL